MQKAKYFTRLCVVLAFCVLALIGSAFAAESAEGTIGDSTVTWSFDGDTGALYIGGYGEAPVFESKDDQPWADFREDVTEVWYLSMGDITIPDMAYWFDGCINMTRAEVSYTTSVIGTRAFADCPNLATIMFYYMDTETFSIAEDAFYSDDLVKTAIYCVTDERNTLNTLSSYNWSSNYRNVTLYDIYTAEMVGTTTAFAVINTDGSMVFYNRVVSAVPAAGDTYDGKTATAVYTGFDTAKYTAYSSVPWYSDGNYASVTSVSFVDTVAPVSTAFWFDEMTKLTSCDLANLDTSNVTNMRAMFYNCSSLTGLDVSGFDTAKVTSMSAMFYNCSSLTGLDVSGFNTTNVTNISFMFSNCASLTSLDVSGFDTAKVTNMNAMFDNCSSLTGLDVSGFNTTNVTGMASMFSNCASLTSLDASGFNTAKVTNMAYMFYNCSSLTSLDVSGFDTAKVPSMAYMFSDCGALTSLDLSSFNTANVTSMNSMFSGCDKLTTIYASDLWTTDVVTSSTSMFTRCTKLVGGNGTSVVTKCVYDATYACIDTPDQAGYLTEYVYYHVVFNGNNNTGGSMSNQTFTYGTAQALTANAFTRAYTVTYNYNGNGSSNTTATATATFNGWATSASGSVVYADKASVSNLTSTSGGTYNLYANWTLGSVTLPTPTRTGYTFAGWYTAASGGTKIGAGGASYTPSATITLYAQWTANTYYVAYDANGGSGTMSNSTHTYDTAKNLTANTFTRDRYVFIGWSTDSTATTPTYTDGQSVSNLMSTSGGAVTLYAVWDPIVTFAVINTDGTMVFYDRNGSVPSVGDTFNDKSVSAVYTGLNTSAFSSYSSVPWYKDSNYKNVTSVSFADTVAPVSTAYWFYKMTALTSCDLSNLDTSNVTTMSSMFSGCSGLTSLDVSGFDTSIVTSMNSMFGSCGALTSLDVSNFNTAKVTSMVSMFYDCSSLTSLDVSGFNTANVTNMASMFGNCGALTSLDLSSFNTANVTSMEKMFYGCKALTSLNISSFNTAEVTSMVSMFHMCSSLTNLDVSGFNTAKVTSMKNMFSNCRALTRLDLSNFNTANVTNMTLMFSSCGALTSLDLSSFNTAKVTSMKNMFSNCGALTNLDLSSFNAANVTALDQVFHMCSSLTNLDLSNFNTANVTTMWAMFYGCSSLTSLDVSGFDTSNVTNMIDMFSNCGALTSLDLSSFNTANVTSMACMFNECSSLTNLDLSSFNTANLKNTLQMFYKCSSLTSLDLSSFDTTNVTRMAYMFSNCGALTSLDLSSFNTANVTNMNCMFNECSSLTTIYVSDLWKTDKITSSSDMFAGCTVLVGGNGTSVANMAVYDVTYACIDKPGQIGYLTDDVYFYVIFDENSDTSGSMETQTFIYGEAQNLTANTFARTGYTYLGWSTSSSATAATYTDGQSVSNLTSTPGGKVTLYAVWQANNYTITWDSNGGSSVADTTQTYDAYLDVPSDPNRTGYTFLGWFTTKTGSTQVTSSTVYKTASNTTYYAHWQNNNFLNISVNPVGATIKYNDSHTMSVTANGLEGLSVLTYQWQISKDSGSTWTNISGATASSFATDATLDVATYLYRVIVVSSFGVSTDADYATKGNISGTSGVATVVVERAASELEILDPTTGAPIDIDGTTIVYNLAGDPETIAEVTSHKDVPVSVATSDKTKVKAELTDDKVILTPVGSTSDQNPVTITIITKEDPNYVQETITLTVYVADGPYITVTYDPDSLTNQDVTATIRVTDVMTYIDNDHYVESNSIDIGTLAAVSAPDIKYGDVNNDGRINASDATAIRAHVSGYQQLTGDQLMAADVDGNGYITTWDADLVSKFVASTITNFPVDFAEYYETTFAEDGVRVVTSVDGSGEANATTKTLTVDWIDKNPPVLSVCTLSVDETNGGLMVYIQAYEDTANTPYTSQANLVYCWDYDPDSATNTWESFSIRTMAPGTLLNIAVKDEANNVSTTDYLVSWQASTGNSDEDVLSNVYNDFSGYIFGFTSYMEDSYSTATAYPADGYVFSFKVKPSSTQYVAGEMTLAGKKFPVNWYSDETLTTPLTTLADDGSTMLANETAYGVVVLNPLVFATKTVKNATAVLTLNSYDGTDMSSKTGSEKYSIPCSIDITGPTITVNYDSYSKELSMRAVDTLAGVKDNQITYTINGSTATGATSTVIEYPTDDSTGTFTVTVTAVDNLGNSSTSTEQSYRPHTANTSGGAGGDSSAVFEDVNLYVYRSRNFTHYIINGTRNNSSEGP